MGPGPELCVGAGGREYSFTALLGRRNKVLQLYTDIAKIHFSSSPERAESVSVCEVILVKYLGLDLNIKTIYLGTPTFSIKNITCINKKR